MTGKIGDVKQLQEVVSRPQILLHCRADSQFHMSISIVTTVLHFIFFQTFYLYSTYFTFGGNTVKTFASLPRLHNNLQITGSA